MASGGDDDMGFVPMISILKKPDPSDTHCTDWVATEKVHGSSFQIYSEDGVNIRAGSRNRNLDGEVSFIRCDIKKLLKKYEAAALKTWDIIRSGKKWEQYRETSTEFKGDTDDDSDDDQSSKNYSDLGEICRVRIYGELYGGGGIDLPEKSAAQKEIIYCDEFRFYVFGLTINKKWVNIQELNDLCKEAGFPYYAKPVCEPMATMEDLKTHLQESGFMKSRSALTEKNDDLKCNVEGVVMTPLKRPDYKLHAVKFLAEAFLDVKDEQFGKTKTVQYCTKQRYHSVISKLDIHERNDTTLVVNMYIDDIIKEMENKNVHYKMKEKWAKNVLEWLVEDEYNADPEVLQEIVSAGGGEKRQQEGKQKKKKGKYQERPKQEVPYFDDEESMYASFYTLLHEGKGAVGGEKRQQEGKGAGGGEKRQQEGKGAGGGEKRQQEGKGAVGGEKRQQEGKSAVGGEKRQQERKGAGGGEKRQQEGKGAVGGEKRQQEGKSAVGGEKRQQERKGAGGGEKRQQEGKGAVGGEKRQQEGKGAVGGEKRQQEGKGAVGDEKRQQEGKGAVGGEKRQQEGKQKKKIGINQGRPRTRDEEPWFDDDESMYRNWYYLFHPPPQYD